MNFSITSEIELNKMRNTDSYEILFIIIPILNASLNFKLSLNEEKIDTKTWNKKCLKLRDAIKNFYQIYYERQFIYIKWWDDVSILLQCGCLYLMGSYKI